MKLRITLNSFYKQLLCFSILFLTIRTQAITQAYLPEGKTEKVRLTRLARQEDELAPIHQANQSMLEELSTSVSNDFDGTYTVVEEITLGAPIKVSDDGAVGATVTSISVTLNNSGKYQLCADMTKKIVIAASNVDLDLNQYSISRTVSSEKVLRVEPGFSFVSIRNGTVSNTVGSSTCIYINANTSNITIENMTTYGPATGISAAASAGNEITNLKISSCRFNDSFYNSIFLGYVHVALVENCIAESNNNGRFAYQLNTCESCHFKNCVSLEYENSSSSVTNSFRLLYGSYNRLENCLIQYLNSTYSDLINATGIYLLTETKTDVINCNVQIINRESGNVEATVLGIYLAAAILTGGDLLASVGSIDPISYVLQGIQWSPDERYLLTAGAVSGATEMNFAPLIAFNGTTLNYLGSITGSAITSGFIKWSPDGSFFAGANNNGSSDTLLDIHQFTGAGNSSKKASITLGASEISDLNWSPDGKFIAISQADGTISIFAISADHTEISPAISTISPSKTPACLGWSPDGKHLAVGSIYSGSNAALYVYTVNNGYMSLADSITSPNSFTDLAWAPQGLFIATGDKGGTVRIFRLQASTLTLRASNSTATGFVNAVAWSPASVGGTGYVTSGDDNGDDSNSAAYVRVYSYNYETTLSHLKGVDTGGYSINGVDWSPSGRYIATSDGEPLALAGNVRVYDAMSACESCSIIGNTVSCTSNTSDILGIGILPGGGSNFFANNTCCFNEVNYIYGIPDVYYGTHNKPTPSPNISMPLVY